MKLFLLALNGVEWNVEMAFLLENDCDQLCGRVDISLLDAYIIIEQTFDSKLLIIVTY